MCTCDMSVCVCVSSFSDGNRRKKRHEATATETTLSPWDLEGKRFQSLLWELSSEERHFDLRLKEAREIRDAEKMAEQERERKEPLGETGDKRERKKRVRGVREEEREKREGVGKMVERWREEEREEWEEWRGEGDFRAETMETPSLGPGLHSDWNEVEWNQDKRKILMELGLAVEWNSDANLEREGGADGERPDGPEFMGLTLLSADHFSTEHASKPLSTHTD